MAEFCKVPDISKTNKKLPGISKGNLECKSEQSKSQEKNRQVPNVLQEIARAISMSDGPDDCSSFDDIHDFFITDMPNSSFSDPDKLKDYLNLAMDSDILLKVDGKYKLNMVCKDDPYRKISGASYKKPNPGVPKVSHRVLNDKSDMAKSPEEIRKVTDTLQEIVEAMAKLDEPDNGSSFDDIYDSLTTDIPNSFLSDPNKLKEYLKLAVDHDILLEIDGKYILELEMDGKNDKHCVSASLDRTQNPDSLESAQHALEHKSKQSKSPEKDRQITDPLRNIVVAISMLKEPGDGCSFDELCRFFATADPNTPLSDPSQLEEYLKLAVDRDILLKIEGKYKPKMASRTDEYWMIPLPSDKKEHQKFPNTPRIVLKRIIKEINPDKICQINDSIRDICKAIYVLNEPEDGSSFDELYAFFKTAMPKTSLSDSNQLEEELKLAVGSNILLKIDGRYKINMDIKKPSQELPDISQQISEGENEISKIPEKVQEATFTIKEICKAIAMLNKNDGASFEDIYQYFQTKQPNTPLSDSKHLEHNLQIAVDCDIILEIDERYKLNMEIETPSLPLPDTSPEGKSKISKIPENVQEATFTIKEICKVIAELSKNDGASFEDIYQYFQTKKPNTPLSDSKHLEENLQLAVDCDILLKIDGRYKLNTDKKAPNLPLPDTSPKDKSEISKTAEKIRQDPIQEIVEAITLLDEPDNGSSFDDIYEFFTTNMPNTLLSDPHKLKEFLNLAEDCDILFKINGNYKLNMCEDDEY